MTIRYNQRSGSYEESDGHGGWNPIAPPSEASQRTPWSGTGSTTQAQVPTGRGGLGTPGLPDLSRREGEGIVDWLRRLASPDGTAGLNVGGVDVIGDVDGDGAEGLSVMLVNFFQRFGLVFVGALIVGVALWSLFNSGGGVKEIAPSA